jgi:hypothetical protein
LSRSPNAYTRAILTSDARGLAALFTVDGYLMPPHVPAATGQAAIQQGYETLFRGAVKITKAVPPVDKCSEPSLRGLVQVPKERRFSERFPDGDNHPSARFEGAPHLADRGRLIGDELESLVTKDASSGSM